MPKPVDSSEKLCRTDPNVSKGGPVSFRDPTTAGHLDGKLNRRTHGSPSEGSQIFNGEPGMRNRLHVSFWGLRLDAVGIFAIAAAVLIVLVFALLLALRF